MPIVKFSFKGLNALNEFRPFEDGESVRFVVCVDVPGTYTKGRFTPSPDGNNHSLFFVSSDGRGFLLSRLWAKRGGKTLADAPEEARRLGEHLSLNKGEKIRQYLQRAGVRGEFSDDAIIVATIRLAHVEDSDGSGYKDWSWLEDVRLTPVTPVPTPTAEQKKRVEDWCTNANAANPTAGLTIADDEIGWFAAALGF